MSNHPYAEALKGIDYKAVQQLGVVLLLPMALGLNKTANALYALETYKKQNLVFNRPPEC